MDGKYGYIDPAGALVIPLDWDIAYPFRGGVAMAKKGDEQHLIDRDGNTLYVLPKNCASMYEYYLEDGLLLVTDSPLYIDGNRNNAMHYGFVDFSGQTIVPCEYDELYYVDGYFYGLRDAWLTILDREGSVVF